MNIRTQKAEGLKTEILKAAITCLQHFGPAKTSMSDVAKAAGVTRKTVHNHFSTKATLIGAAVAFNKEIVSQEALRKLDFDLAPVDFLVEAQLCHLEVGLKSRLADRFLDHSGMSYAVEAVQAELSEHRVQPYRIFWDPVLDHLSSKGVLRRARDDETFEWLEMIHFSLLMRAQNRRQWRKELKPLILDYIVPSMLIDQQ